MSSQKIADDLVVQSRLKQIEKEHRSAGAMLDHRQLFKLDDTPKPFMQSRGRRRKTMPEHQDEHKMDSSQKVDPQTQGRVDETSTISGDFKDEEAMWKTKSSDPNYSLKRKYHNPELQEFLENMDLDDKIMFKYKVKEKLHSIALKFRAELVSTKADMNIAGIFHPEANAHRAHCLYVMKLYKAINSEAIEDPILRSMRNDQLAKERKLALEEKQRLRLIRLAELGEHANEKDIEEAANEMQNAHLDSSLHEQDKHNAGKKARPKIYEPKYNVTKSTVHTNKASLAPLSNLAGAPAAEAFPDNHKIANAKRGPASPIKIHANTSATLPEKTNEVQLQQGAPVVDKIFRKIKQGKLGAADPRELLQDEASRLDRADSIVAKRKSDRNSIMDQDMIDWIVSNLQGSEIVKGSLGPSANSVDDLASVSSSQRKLRSQGGGELLHPTSSSASASSLVDAKTRALSAVDLPTFDAFYDMFQRYGQLSEEREIATAASKADDANKLVISNGASLLRKSESTLKQDDSTASKQDSETKLVGKGIDLLQELANQEPQFENYLKTTLREQPMAKRLGKGSAKLTKPRKIRHIPPLGKAAIDMLDSKGVRMKMADKGFRNHFQDKKQADSDSDDESAPTDEMATLEISTANDIDEKELIPTDSVVGEDERPTKSPITSRSPTRTGSPSRRSILKSSRSQRGSPNKGLLTSDDPTESLSKAIALQGKTFDIQEKLSSIWSLLQVPTSFQLSFMRKYSTENYITELSRAADMWSEAAVFVVGRLEVLKLSKKYKCGFCVLPLTMADVIESFKRHVPASLSSIGGPMYHSYADLDNPATSLSAAAYRTVIDGIISMEKSFALGGNIDTDAAASDCIDHTRRFIDTLLSNSAKRLFDELDDVVHFGASTYKEWINSTSNLH